jgi:hypothetical protein
MRPTSVSISAPRPESVHASIVGNPTRQWCQLGGALIEDWPTTELNWPPAVDFDDGNTKIISRTTTQPRPSINGQRPRTEAPVS